MPFSRLSLTYFLVALLCSVSMVMATWSPTEVLYEFMRPRAEGENLQTFSGDLGAPAPPISDTGDSSRPFSVDGSTFSDFKSASIRSCDVQFDNCQKKANDDGSFSVNECDSQKDECYTAQENAPVKAFTAETKEYERVPFDSEFDLL
ncbi:hypothetical protein FQN54_008933, partial [Arachnomyces sp. PD_36]